MKQRGCRRGVVLAILCTAAVASSCGAKSSAFCAALRAPEARFEPGRGSEIDVRRHVAAIDALISTMGSQQDRADLQGVRDFAALLYQMKPNATASERERIVATFYGNISPHLDNRLRNECRIHIVGKPQIGAG